MSKQFFKHLENQAEGYQMGLAEFTDQLTFNTLGLIPVITQHYQTNQVLMMAWMNQQAIMKTLQTGRAVYWSRSRQRFWVKGEESGHIQRLISMHADCDGDCLLIKVDQQGQACHTFRSSCFFWHLDSASKQARIQSG